MITQDRKTAELKKVSLVERVKLNALDSHFNNAFSIDMNNTIKGIADFI